MKVKIFLISITLLSFFSGCGKIEDDEGAGTTETSYDNYTPAANNQCSSDQQNSAGCFGNEPYFAENRVDEGFWSLYKKSDSNKNYYNTYYKSYKFLSDGSVKKRFESEGYYRIDGTLWGVNDDADTINIDNGDSLSLTGRRYSGTDCYDVTHSGATYKICAEVAISTSLQNSSGYYGDSIYFGNYNFGNYSVEGNWTIAGVEIALNSDGSTSNGGEWGVSEDAKVITIDAISYIVNRYPDNDCIDTYTLVSNTKQDSVRLCKL